MKLAMALVLPVGMLVMLVGAGAQVQKADHPIIVLARVRVAQPPPTTGPVSIVLETSQGPLTITGKLEESLTLRWLALRHGELVTLAVESPVVPKAPVIRIVPEKRPLD